MKEITSVNNELIKQLAKLKDKKYRDENKRFLIEGYHLIAEAKEYLELVLITNPSDYINGVSNILVTEEIIKKISQTKTPQNIVGVCRYFDNKQINYSLNKYIILDNIQDPGNLGTIVRSALGFNIDYCILSKSSVDIYNDKFIRSTQGALFKMNVVYDDLFVVIDKMKKNNIEVIGTSLKGGFNVKEIKKPKKYALVLGNEANGVSKEILDITDCNVYIKTNERLESLNVAVAGAILMFYLNE